MTGMFHRRLGVLLVSAAVALGVWKWVPGTAVDRMAFTTVAGGFANPPLFVSGNGNAADPWKLRVSSSEPKLARNQVPSVVSLGDDLNGFFQKSPPAPIDMAVIFKNFHRLEKTKVASAAVLAWESPDPIGLVALEKSLSGFESLVMAAPLSRGAISAAMPPAFRRASLPLTAIHGDTSVLPVVNRIPVPGVVLGGDTSLAGFSVLESEAAAGFSPLVARWEDRVVFAFPLLTALQRLNLPTEGLEVRLGEFIKLSPNGPVVRIDDFGRLALPIKPLATQADIPAEAVIDGGHDLFPEQAPTPLILRDDQSAAEPGTRAFSRSLTAVIAAIAANGGLGEANAYPRLPPEWEIGMMSLVVVMLTLLCGVAARQYGFFVLGAVGLSAQWIAFGTASIWLPGLPMLASIGAAVMVANWIGQKIPERLVAGPISVPEVGISSEPEPLEPVASAKKASTRTTKKPPPKSPAKEAPAKKVPAKKVAKKAAKTITPRKTATKIVTKAAKAAKPKAPPRKKS